MAGHALWLSLATLLACSGADTPETRDVLPLLAGDAGPVELVAFVDESTGFETLDVHDATRDVVRFDAAHGAMVSLDGSVAVSGWATTGNELSWSRSGVAFRVRFGTELGERRAFFTETATGTICDLRLYGPDQLGISGTSELPPNP
jgi:hypothetical protein